MGDDGGTISKGDRGLKAVVMMQEWEREEVMVVERWRGMVDRKVL